MGEIRKIDIAVGAEIATAINAAVASSEFASVEDVVAAALGVWTMERVMAEPENVQRLRQLWEEGIASGPAVEITDEWFESIKRRGQARVDARAEHGGRVQGSRRSTPDTPRP